MPLGRDGWSVQLLCGRSAGSCPSRPEICHEGAGHSWDTGNGCASVAIWVRVTDGRVHTHTHTAGSHRHTAGDFRRGPIDSRITCRSEPVTFPVLYCANGNRRQVCSSLIVRTVFLSWRTGDGYSFNFVGSVEDAPSFSEKWYNSPGKRMPSLMQVNRTVAASDVNR